MKKTSNKKFLAAIASCGLISALGIGGTLAYLTDSESHTNTFTYGNVELDLTETSWNDSAAHVMVPGRQIAKNPQGNNTGTESEWIIMKVVMPYVADAVTINPSTGAPNAAANTPAFIMNGIDSDSWTLLNSGPVYDSTAKTATYVYGLNTAVAAGANSGELFTSVTMANFQDGITVDGNDIVVTAYGIQAEGVADVATAWTLVQGQGTTTREANTGGHQNLAGQTIGG